jgi:hypothetical protein
MGYYAVPAAPPPAPRPPPSLPSADSELFLLGLSLCSSLGVNLGIPLAADCPDQRGDPLIGIELTPTNEI